MVHNPRIREGIIRALTEKDANAVAAEALLNAFFLYEDITGKIGSNFDTLGELRGCFSR